MFKLILIITVIATGQTSKPLQHRDSFPTIEACFAMAAAADADVRASFSERVGSPVSTSYQCELVKQSSSLEDRAADAIATVLREMNRRGGIAAAPNHSGL